MKFNWKILVACVVILGIIFWAVTSLLSHSYSGSDLNFAVGGGPVTVTNASDAPVAVQLLGTGARTFNVVSDTEGLAGSSTRTGTGNSATQLYDMTLPSGVTVFSVLRGTNITFVSPAPLDVTVQPVTGDDARTTLIVTVIVILVALFFISQTTGHHWINQLRGIKPPPPPVISTAGGQGASIKSYGDNSR